MEEQEKKVYKNIEEEHYYSINNDPLIELAQDIIEETVFFREEGNILPPLPTSIANDTNILDVKIK